MKLIDLDKNNQTISSLNNLLDNTGNCIMNGFLGEELSDIYFDEDGMFHYTTNCMRDDTSIRSEGVVYPGSLLLKQTQNNHGTVLYHLYSWDIEDCNYTFLSFDSSEMLDYVSERIKRFQINLCSDDITELFKDMNLDFNHIDRILVNQSTNPLSQMFDDQFSKSEKERSFHL